jgi:hypothetical protein
MVDANLTERVRALCGARALVESHTELYRDLGLNGDDAWDLLENIRKDRGVDFSGFEFDRYFPNETDAIYYLWGRRFGLWRNRFKPMTIAHLTEVIERGRWFEPNAQ